MFLAGFGLILLIYFGSTVTVDVDMDKVEINNNQELVDEAISGVKYFYARNIDSSNFVVLQTTASVQYARLSPGEFCFFPINDGAGLEARADTASCVLEFAFWTKA